MKFISIAFSNIEGKYSIKLQHQVDNFTPKVIFSKPQIECQSFAEVTSSHLSNDPLDFSREGKCYCNAEYAPFTKTREGYLLFLILDCTDLFVNPL